MPLKQPPLTVNITDAAELIGCKKSFLYRELRAGNIKLPVIKLGARSLIRVADIEQWLEDRQKQDY